MFRTYDQPHRGCRRLIGVAVIAVLLCCSAGIYLALTADPSREAAAATKAGTGDRGVATAPSKAPNPVRVPAVVPPIKATSDPQVFAGEVVHALFDWDTTGVPPRSDYAGRLVAVADPSGEEAPGLVADLANYLPNPAAWTQLRPYATRQWIEVDSVGVPGVWPRIVATVSPGRLRPGTGAFTIHGVRHRAGLWEGRPVTSVHDVAFSVFVLCRPSYPTCHVLRLSRLDHPLS